MKDTFRGDTAALIRNIDALLELDAAGALVPHGVGGHARGLLEAASVRLAAVANPAAPAQAGEHPAGTGNPEADRIIQRLASSDPDFDDCADAVALIHKLVAEIKGPDGFATWKDAAIADRAARGAAQAAPVDATNWQPVAVPAAWAATSEEGSVEALGMNQSRRFDTPLYAAPQPAAQALDAARVFWQQHTHADALSMTMAELHDDVEIVIRAARGAAQAAPVVADVQDEECDVPPFGWRCTREKDHEGPCAAVESPEDKSFVERGMRRIRDAEDAGRYRLLKRGQHWSVIDGAGNTLRAEVLDVAVDAAIAAQQVKQP